MRFSVCLIAPETYKYSHFLYDTCKYYCYTIEAAGHECCMVRNHLYSDRINIIIGAHNITDPAGVEQIRNAGKYVVIQSEVLTDDSISGWPVQESYANIYLPLLRQADAVWDSLESNLMQLKKFGIDAELHSQVGYLSAMEEIKHKRIKDIDFLYYGSVTPHRKKLLDELQKRGGNIVCVFDEAAIFRNDLIARTRVNLAPNQAPGVDHLSSRVLYLLNNRSVVVAERCYNQDWVEHCFLSANTEEWVDLCLETIRRPDLDQLSDKFFEQYKKLDMVDLIKPLIEKLATGSDRSIRFHAAAQSSEYLDLQLPLYDASSSAVKTDGIITGMTSIVIVIDNQLKSMKEFFEGIKNHTPESHEVILVDNATTDGTKEWLRRFVKENGNCRLIENEKNLGFAKARNRGIEASAGEHIMLLNNDVVVAENWLSGMLECLKSAPDAGIVGPVIAGEICSQTTGEMKLPSDGSRHLRMEAKSVGWRCMLFNRVLSDEIGLLDETLESCKYVAEDYCLRARLEGYGNLIAGDVFVDLAGTPAAKTETMGKNAYYEKWSGIGADSELGKKLLAVKALDKADEFFQRGDTEKAVQVLIEGMRYAPGDARLYYFLLDILIDTKQFKEALDVIERMPVDVSDDRRLALTGYCKAGMDIMDEADEYADKALGRNDSSAIALNLKGIVAFKRGDRITASDLLEKALKADPGYGEPYTNLGVIRWSGGNITEGLDFLEKGFILSPLLSDIIDAYYSAISQTGDFGRLEKTLRQTACRYPLNRRINFLLISSLMQQGKDKIAMMEIERAMIAYGIDEGILSAALTVREKVGAKEIVASKKDANISLCMIVKNEEANLGKCLLSVESLVDEMIVVDTGSTDRTREIAKAFGAKVYDFEWTDDFSEARNVSLSKAKGDWILVLDADEVISHRDFDTLRKLVGRKKRENAYSITTRNYVDCANVEGWTKNDGIYDLEEAGTGWLPSFKVRLFPNDGKIRFEHPVHELVELSLKRAGKRIINCAVPIHHYGKLNKERSLVKGEGYYQLGKKKLDEQGDEVMPLLELALQASELQKYEEARDLLLRLLRLDPNFAKAHFNLGYLYLKLRNYTEGIKSSKRALEIDPNIKEAVLNYASCEVYGGNVNNAVTALEDMLIKNPGHPPATALLGIAYIAGGKIDDGIACLEKIKKMNADCPGVILDHAKEFVRAERTDFALQLLETAVGYGYVNSGILSLLEEIKKR